MFEHLPFSVLQTRNTQHRSDKWRRVKSVSVSQSAEKVNNKQITTNNSSNLSHTLFTLYCIISTGCLKTVKEDEITGDFETSL